MSAKEKKQLNKNKRKSNHAEICFTELNTDKQEEQLSKKLATFKKLFQENSEVKNFKYNVTFKNDFKVEQQRGRRIPIHVQKAVEEEIKKLTEEGHITKIEQLDEDTFVSPAVIAVKSDGSVKIAMDAIQLNKQIVKKKSQMPNLQELLDRISVKINKIPELKLYITVIDLKYAFGQIRLHEETSRHCVIAIVGGKVTGHYRFNKGFYGLADIPVIFQEKLDKILNYKTPVWQDDIIVVTRGSPDQHFAEVSEKLLKKMGIGLLLKSRNFSKTGLHGVVLK